ncbi:MAG: LamG-like jellyroll fold domain-containing protein, partial [Planctomycetota bacterium]
VNGAEGQNSVSQLLGWKKRLKPGEPNLTDPNVTAHYVYVDTYDISADPGIADFNEPPDEVIAVGDYGQLLKTNLGTDKKVYWRVDEGINGSAYDDPNTSEGDVWVFTTESSIPRIVTQPMTVLRFEYTDPNYEGDAVFSCVFTCPGYGVHETVWYHDGVDVNSLADPNIIISELVYDPLTGEYLCVLTIENVDGNNEGAYTFEVANTNSDMAVSAAASLGVKRLMANWTMDKSRFVSGWYLDEQGDYPAMIVDLNYEPNFVAGFDGSTEGAVIIDHNSIGYAGDWDPSEFTGQITISVWARLQQYAGFSMLIAKSNGGLSDPDTMMWELGHPGEESYGSIQYDVGGNIIIRDGELILDQWKHICITFDGNETKLYTQGEVAETTTGYQLGLDQTAPIYLGARWNDSAGWLEYYGDNRVAVDEVRIYNYAIEAKDVADLYLQGPATYACLYLDDAIKAYDLNGDCIINMLDFAQFAADWLLSGMY